MPVEWSKSKCAAAAAAAADDNDDDDVNFVVPICLSVSDAA